MIPRCSRFNCLLLHRIKAKIVLFWISVIVLCYRNMLVYYEYYDKLTKWSTVILSIFRKYCGCQIRNACQSSVYIVIMYPFIIWHWYALLEFGKARLVIIFRSSLYDSWPPKDLIFIICGQYVVRLNVKHVGT